jgi:hypothetical protein
MTRRVIGYATCPASYTYMSIYIQSTHLLLNHRVYSDLPLAPVAPIAEARRGSPDPSGALSGRIPPAPVLSEDEVAFPVTTVVVVLEVWLSMTDRPLLPAVAGGKEQVSSNVLLVSSPAIPAAPALLMRSLLALVLLLPLRAEEEENIAAAVLPLRVLVLSS